MNTPILDESTLLWLLVVLPLLLGAVCLAIRHGNDAAPVGLRTWALSQFGWSVGFLTVVLFAPSPARQIVGNSLFILAALAMQQAWRKLIDAPAAMRPWMVFAVLAIAINVPLALIPGFDALRISVAVSATTVLAGHAALGLVHWHQGRRWPGHWVGTAGLLGLVAANGVRLAALVDPDLSEMTLGSGSRISVPGSFALQLLGNTIATFGVLMVVTQRMNTHLAHLAAHDSLTGLLTRRGFSTSIAPLLARQPRHPASLAFLIVDIDFFKQINDQHGHQAGDRVLQQLAERLSEQCRGGDVLARFGGEEFVMLLANAPPEQAGLVAERLRSAIAAQPVAIRSGETVVVTVSVGVATSRAGDADLESLYREADAALYRAKETGRNRVVTSAPA